MRIQTKAEATRQSPKNNLSKVGRRATRNIAIRQTGGENESEDDITTTYARILYLADRTDLSLRKRNGQRPRTEFVTPSNFGQQAEANPAHLQALRRRITRLVRTDLHRRQVSGAEKS